MREINLDLLERFETTVLNTTGDDAQEQLQVIVREYLAELYINCSSEGGKAADIDLQDMIPVIDEMISILNIKYKGNQLKGKPEYLDTVINMNRKIRANELVMYKKLIMEIGRQKLSRSEVKNIIL